MLRFILLLSLFVISVHGARADSGFDQLLTGVALISQQANIEIDDAGTITQLSENGTGFGIYTDKYLNGEYRLSGIISFVDYTDFYVMSAAASADYLMPITAQYAGFMGAGLGLSSQNYSNSSVSESALAMSYGVQLGMIAFVSNQLMLEVGYRLRATDLKTEFLSGKTGTLDEITESYLSIIFTF